MTRIDLRKIVNESNGLIDERDISVLAKAEEVGAIQSLFKVLRAAQKEIQKEVRDKARLSDVFSEDVRFRVGMDKMADEVLSIPQYARNLAK